MKPFLVSFWLLKFGHGVAGDFFRDLQEQFQNWEANASSQGKPKSLWEELAVRVFIYVLLFFHGMASIYEDFGKGAMGLLMIRKS